MVSQEEVIEVLKTVIDPELNIDIWTLGLIYSIVVQSSVRIRMTYTTPLCPYGPLLKEEIVYKLKQAYQVESEIEVTFDPPYEMPQDLRTFFGV